MTTRMRSGSTLLLDFFVLVAATTFSRARKCVIWGPSAGRACEEDTLSPASRLFVTHGDFSFGPRPVAGGRWFRGSGPGRVICVRRSPAAGLRPCGGGRPPRAARHRLPAGRTGGLAWTGENSLHATGRQRDSAALAPSLHHHSPPATRSHNRPMQVARRGATRAGASASG